MAKECINNNCNQESILDFKYCANHIKEVTKVAIKLMLIDIIEYFGVEFETLNIYSSNVKAELAIDSLDEVDLIMRIDEIIFEQNMPEEFWDTLEPSENSIHELIEKVYLKCLDLNKFHTPDNIGKAKQKLASLDKPKTIRKISKILSDPIYDEVLKIQGIHKNQFHETLKHTLKNRIINYSTAIPSMEEKKIISLDVFILSETSVFMYSIQKKQLNIRILKQKDLDLEFDYLYDSKGKIVTIILYFRLKKYVSEDHRTFTFKNEEGITKSLIFLSKFLKIF